MTAAKKKRSPNDKIDKAIEKLMKKLDGDVPLDDAVRVVNSAIAWEKVKGNLQEDEPFNPDDL